MDQERERVQADLRGLLEGEVYCEDAFLQMYASDASIFEIKPLGIIRPRNTNDVVACVQYASENQIPIHARGAGTGLAGESLGRGLVLDFSHAMRRILNVEADTVQTQPGVVLGRLNEQLAVQGRCFGPDPANRAVTTIGSVVAIDAGGSRWLRYGSARRHVKSLKVVLASGETLTLGQHSWQAALNRNDTLSILVQRVAQLIQSNSGLISQYKSRAPVDRSGYRLDDIVEGDQVDLARLMVGSEGTLALFTEATLATERLPKHRGVALLLFDRLENAANAAIELPRHGISACDLLDRRLLRLACESDAAYELLLPPETEAILLVEKSGESAAEVREGLAQIVHLIRRRRRLAFDAKTAIEQDDIDLLWQLPQRVVPTLYRLKGSTRPLPFVEDIVVPPPELPGFLVNLQNVLKKHQVTASLYGHVGHGQLHIRPFLDLSDPEHVRRMQHLATDLYREVLAVGGTVSGEHGDGLSRTWFLREQFGPLYRVFEQLKRIFDPQNILNPGKIVDSHGQSLTQNLRPVSPAGQVRDELSDTSDPDGVLTTASHANPLVQLELNWSQAEIMQAARSCNGCGGCRTQFDGERMCPIFRFAPSEEATPRAKANLMRAFLTGHLDATLLKSPAIKELADLCVNCQQCRLECPANVDIPRLMMECKSQYVSDNGLTTSDWILSRLDAVAAWASLFRPLANWAVGNRTARWLAEKMTGIAQGRKLPRVAARSFLRQAARRRLTRPSRRTGRKVVYFVDVYANWFDTQIAEAFVAILEHNKVAVFVHPQQQQSAMAMITMGAVEKARRIAAYNVGILADAVRQGYHIVATEPAAALALSHEYPYLVDDEDALLVAANTSEACSYLWKMHQSGDLELDLKPVNLSVGYHEPCHARALDPLSPGSNLLRLIPGLSVAELRAGCSGMAGTYGMKRENYRNSLRAGWKLISAMRSPAIQVGTTECSTCKLQMEQGNRKVTVHPLKLLALAYGLIPDIAHQIQPSNEDLIAR